MKGFNKIEADEITKQALKLMENGYFSGINRIQFPFRMDANNAYFVFHYLQDSIKQINFIKSQLPKNIKHAKEVKRDTYYLFDPEYADKPNFEEEYQTADFRRKNLENITIEDVIENPENVIVANKELDFIIAIEDNEESIIKLAKSIYEIDKKGPEKWFHPAMIVRSEKKIKKIPNFKHKTFIAIKKHDDMFYAVIYDKQRLSATEKYITKECENIQKIPGINISFGMVIYNPCQINKEFDIFMKDNLYDLKQLL